MRSPNKLRAFAWVSGTAVVALVAWVAVRYDADRPATLLATALLGAALPAVPWAVVRVRFAVRRGVAALRSGRGGDDRSVFRSTTAVDDRRGTLDAVRDAVRRDGGFDEVRAEAFPEGRGLTVVHAGFHNSFVRVTPEGRVVVTGDSERTRDVRRIVERTRGLDLVGVRTNPHAGPTPVRGGSRVVLAAALAGVVVLAGVVTVGVAYPASTYNPSEKAAFVGIDARAALDPGYSRTDAALAKASLMVVSVREESAEFAWKPDDSPATVVAHAEEALAAAADVRRLLATVRAGSPTAAQRARADRIEARLVSAERRLAATIAARNENRSDPDPATVAARRRLLADANRTAGTDAAASQGFVGERRPARAGRRPGIFISALRPDGV